MQFLAGLYNYAVKNHIKYVLTGANNATECIRPPIEWVYQNDLTMIKDIPAPLWYDEAEEFPDLQPSEKPALLCIFPWNEACCAAEYDYL